MFERQGMTRGKMTIIVPFLDQEPGHASPYRVPEAVQVVAEIPCDVREWSKAINRVVNESTLIAAELGGMYSAVVHVQNERHDHVPVTCIPQCPIKLLPVVNVETLIIESWMKNVV